MPETVQRLQIRFGAEGPLRYISHLDLMRAWERACKRAGLPLNHSQGFSPRPKIALAAPLPVGVSSECELLDARLDARVGPQEAMEALRPQLPEGCSISEIAELPLRHPSLQSLVRAARYEVDVPSERSEAEWGAVIECLLGLDELPWRQERGGKVREFDLRALVYEIEVDSAGGGEARMRMRLRNDERGAGRAEHVLEALEAGAAATRIHRAALELESVPGAGEG